MSKLEQFNFDNGGDMAQWSRNELNAVTVEGSDGAWDYDVEIFRSPMLTVYRGVGHVKGIRHIHPMFEDDTNADNFFLVAYFAKGDGPRRIWQGDREITLHEGDLTLIDAREAYSLGECENATEFLYFRLSCETLIQWIPLVESRALVPVSTKHGWGHLLGNYLSQLNPTSLSKLGSDPSMLKVLPEHIASMLRNALFDQQESETQLQPNPHISRSKRLYRQVITWLRENFAAPDLTLDVIAAHFHLSARQLSRIILKETDESIPNILIRMRINHAADMLSLRAYDHLTVADVAVSVGMPNAATFHRNFIRIIGASPAKFRSEQRAARSMRAAASAQNYVADGNPADVRQHE